MSWKCIIWKLLILLEVKQWVKIVTRLWLKILLEFRGKAAKTIHPCVSLLGTPVHSVFSAGGVCAGWGGFTSAGVCGGPDACVGRSTYNICNSLQTLKSAFSQNMQLGLTPGTHTAGTCFQAWTFLPDRHKLSQQCSQEVFFRKPSSTWGRGGVRAERTPHSGLGEPLRGLSLWPPGPDWPFA